VPNLSLPKAPLPIEDYRTLAELRYQIRRFLQFSERAARAAGIEPQQHQLLLACKGLPQASRPNIGTLAERLCVEHHTAVGLVDKLEASGFVERVRGDSDKREVLVRIRSEGERVLAQLSAEHRQQLRSSGPMLRDALATLLSEPTPGPR
jgi:DNA-binding MarR family transcriptional regulator